MVHVKFRRWGPYVWWICPSRKCSFENKTDLAFVTGAYQTKCQYCNTPITIKQNAGQLVLESMGIEEEEAKPSAAQAAAKAPTVLTPQAPTTSTPAASTSSSNPKQNIAAPSSSPAQTNNAQSDKQMAQVALQDSKSSEKPKEPKKKAAS